MTNARAAAMSAARVQLSRGRRDELAARVARLAMSGDALPVVLNAIVAEMAREGLRGAAIALVNEHDELYLAAHDGEVDDAVLNSRLPVGTGIMGTVAATGVPLLVGDLDDSRLVANRKLGTNASIRSLAAVPIRADGRVLGVLEIDSRKPDQFDGDDLALLHRLALAISGAVLQAGPLRLANEKLRRRVNELTHLRTAARILAASLDLDEVLDAVIDVAGRALDAESVLLVRRQGDDVSVAAGAGAGSTPRPALEVLGEAAPLLGGGSAKIYATAAHIPVLAPARAAGMEASAVAVVPGARGVDGLLIVATSRAGGFDTAELRLLEGIADLAGLAISNAERYRELGRVALTDALTGVGNAAAFERALGAVHLDGLSVIAIDVDRLKEINDHAGYQAGDEALRRIAAALRETVPVPGVLARTGGDEFGLVLPGVSEAIAAEIAERLRYTMYGVALPYGLARITLAVAAGPAGADGREVWLCATEALDSARQWGRDRVALSSGAAGVDAGRRRRWDAVVDEVVEARHIGTAFQAVVRLGDLAVVGYEALSRPPQSGADASVEGLFAAAQRTGLSRDLDWVCRRGAFENARPLAAGVPLFVNVGVWALLDPLHDVDQMLMLCRFTARDPGDVVLEITERELISDLPRLAEVLHSYRSHGFRFAIDDVGEGHSTFEVLATAAPEYVKVARSLTVGSARLGALSAVNALVAFARCSGAQVIAEGIETAADAEIMEGLGVELGQGWWLGRPGPLPAIRHDGLARPELVGRGAKRHIHFAS